jgi:hypothetical protein
MYILYVYKACGDCEAQIRVIAARCLYCIPMDEQGWDTQTTQKEGDKTFFWQGITKHINGFKGSWKRETMGVEREPNVR